MLEVVLVVGALSGDSCSWLLVSVQKYFSCKSEIAANCFIEHCHLLMVVSNVPLHFGLDLLDQVELVFLGQLIKKQ